jgi:hypothetical protein
VPIIQISSSATSCANRSSTNVKSWRRFIAQTPKRPVPNLWFAQDRQGTTGGKGTLNDPKNLEVP